MRKFYLLQLPFQIFQETLAIGLCIVLREALLSIEQVMRHIVIRVHFVACMDTTVYQRRDTSKEFLLWQRIIQFIQLYIDASIGLEMHMPLHAEDTCLHVLEVVSLTFLKGSIITLLLELLRLQIVARIIFIGNGKRMDVHLTKTLENSAFTTHDEHLENAILRTIVGILSPTLSLRYPDGLVLLTDGIVHVGRHAGRRL